MGLHRIEVEKRKILILKKIKKEDEIKWKAHKMPTTRILEFMGFNMFLNAANDSWESRYYILHVKYTIYIFLLKRNGETLD
jgi:hypothetical protein